MIIKKIKRYRKTRGKLSLVNLKVTRKDRLALVARAKKFEHGNLSAWLRRAGLNYKPSNRD